MTEKEILPGLLSPGRQLLFVDDSGTTTKPLRDLPADFYLLAGVLILSDRYPEVKHRMRALLESLPASIDEFHLKDLINPSKDSGWRQVSIDERLKILGTLIEFVTLYADQIVYCFVSKEQFAADILPKLRAAGSTVNDHVWALEQVFFTRVVAHLRAIGNEAAIIVDSKKALGGNLQIQALAYPDGFYQGGIIKLDSPEEEGLQLADFVAFALNRVHHARQKAIDGNANAFDEFFVNAVIAMIPKVVNVLEATPQAPILDQEDQALGFPTN